MLIMGMIIMKMHALLLNVTENFIGYMVHACGGIDVAHTRWERCGPDDSGKDDDARWR
jgi:hypothetical protein